MGVQGSDLVIGSIPRFRDKTTGAITEMVDNVNVGRNDTC
jgi:hypothetical protein